MGQVASLVTNSPFKRPFFFVFFFNKKYMPKNKQIVFIKSIETDFQGKE